MLYQSMVLKFRRPLKEKEDFYCNLRKILSGIGAAENVVVCQDLNGNIGIAAVRVMRVVI